MRQLVTAALALASAWALGQDEQAEAIDHFHEGAALILETFACEMQGAYLCGIEHKGTDTLTWSASCRKAAKLRDFGRGYDGDSELVGKYKDAVLFWDQYCGSHPEY